MSAKFTVEVEVSGKGAHTITTEELQHAIHFGLNWSHGHSYTQATFEVRAERAPAALDGVKGCDK